MAYENEMKMLMANFYIFGASTGFVVYRIMETLLKEPMPIGVVIAFGIISILIGYHSTVQRKQLNLIINLNLPEKKR